MSLCKYNGSQYRFRLDGVSLNATNHQVLQDVAVVAAEDTRVTLKLLSHLGIKGKPLVSCHEHR
jgi:16S rRNA C1402 (ribose-2'-O) methylase RsmI